MTYTFVSAQYADSEGLSVIAETAEAGLIVVSAADRPDEWAALMGSGLSIAAYEPPPDPLVPLNPKQIRLGLLAMGITENDIEAKLALLDEPERTQALIAWRYAPSYVRTDPLLVQIAAVLQLDDATIDQFWRQAMAL